MSHDLFLQGWELQRKGDIVRGLKCYEEAKTLGDKCALFHWNCMDCYGQSIPINVNNQMDWNTFSLNEEDWQCLYACYKDINDVEIRFNLGILHYYFKNKDEGLSCWTALTNYAPAHVGLGVHFEKFKKHKEAFEQYQIASTMGSCSGCYYLASCYKQGRGIDNDHVEALRWYTLGAYQGHANSQFELGNMYKDGIVVKQNYKTAFDYYHLASKYNRKAQSQLGYLYDNGIGVVQNHQEAIRWYQLAADHGSAASLNNLGTMYRDGTGVQRDYTKAIELFLKAIDAGSEKARSNLNTIIKLQSQIVTARDQYLATTEYEGISYLFFSNFLSYLTEKCKIAELYDPLLRSWITDSLMTYFSFLDHNFVRTTIDDWFKEFYGLDE
jgi:TPR repeat protein